jgi:hypothetical protein
VDLDVVFLGTAGSMPTAQRAPSALLVRRGGERLLFDCGEGTQRQLLRSDVGLIDLREVFLTHYHADHYLGLPGMLKSFALRGRDEPITIYGPPGLKELFGALRRIFGRLTYPYDLVELRPGDALARSDYVVRAIPVEHGVSAIGYTLVEPDRPGRFDVETADALGVPSGPERGALQHGEAVTLGDGRVVTPAQVLAPAGPSSSPATRRLRRVSSRRRAAPISSSTKRRSARTSAHAQRRRSTRRQRKPRSSPARRTSGCWRSRTCRTATAVARSPTRRARSFRRRSCRATSTSSSCRSPSAAHRGS